MKKIFYTIEFYSEWHAGSGLNSGSDLNALVIKDKDGFPFIPGRTLKGMLRAAAEDLCDLEAINESFVHFVFGNKTGLEVDPEKGILDYEQLNPTPSANCFFANAELPSPLKSAAGKEFAPFFYREAASTQIAHNGLAKRGSLRVMETTIPCVLEAYIDNFPEEWEKELEMCLKVVKRMGHGRHRGLGRCKLTLKNKEENV